MALDIDFGRPLTIKEIEYCIPHRHPFLLIDRVEDVVCHQYVIAKKCLSIFDCVFQGHFPEKPIYPGVLIIEGMAQAASVLGFANRGKRHAVLTEVIKARFRHQAYPGDVLTYVLQQKCYRQGFYWFEGTAKVSNQLIASVTFSAMID